MNNTTLQLKVKQRLNKLDSFDYDNIECWQIVEAFNKGQLHWVRRQIMGINQLREAAEQSLIKVGDLQILLKDHNLTLSIDGTYYETDELPEDFLHHNRIAAAATKGCCEGETSEMRLYPAEEANVPILLTTEHTKPSFQWRETFFTYVGNRIRIYHNNDFELSSAKLIYYRMPVRIQIQGCVDPHTLETSAVDVESEFKDDIVEILVDEAAKIIAGDIESINQYQIQSASSQLNT